MSHFSRVYNGFTLQQTDRGWIILNAPNRDRAGPISAGPYATYAIAERVVDRIIDNSYRSTNNNSSDYSSNNSSYSNDYGNDDGLTGTPLLIVRLFTLVIMSVPAYLIYIIFIK